MKKVILLIALVFSSFAIQAQDMDKSPVSISFELNGGFLQHDAFNSGSRLSHVDAGEDLII